MSDGFDASAFAARMSSIGHASKYGDGSGGGGGGGGGGEGGGGGGMFSPGNEEHVFHLGAGHDHLQQTLESLMAGHVGSLLFVRGLLEGAVFPLFNLLDQMNLVKILPPSSIPFLPNPGRAVFSPGK